MTGTDCGLFTHKSVPVIFEPPCIYLSIDNSSPVLHIFLVLRFASLYLPVYCALGFRFLCLITLFGSLSQYISGLPLDFLSSRYQAIIRAGHIFRHAKKNTVENQWIKISVVIFIAT